MKRGVGEGEVEEEEEEEEGGGGRRGGGPWLHHTFPLPLPLPPPLLQLLHRTLARGRTHAHAPSVCQRRQQLFSPSMGSW